MGIEIKNGYLVIDSWHEGMFEIPLKDAGGFSYSPEERGFYGCEFRVSAEDSKIIVEGEMWVNGEVEDFKIVVFKED